MSSKMKAMLYIDANLLETNFSLRDTKAVVYTAE